MGCLIPILALFLPRLTMVFIFALTGWIGRAFDGWFWPLLGFLFLPYTTLAMMGAYLNRGNVGGWWLVLVIVAVLADLGSFGTAKGSGD
jgi:hypothetical protein